MANEITAAEQAADKQRKTDLVKAIERMDDVELGLFAKQIGVDPAQHPGRKDLVAAVELQDEANAAAGRQKLRDMEVAAAKDIADEDTRRPPVSRIIRALNAEFCRDIPQEGRGGRFEPDDGDLRFGGDYAVPDGKYRVVGSEWLFEIRKKMLVAAELASEKNRWGGKGVIAID